MLIPGRALRVLVTYREVLNVSTSLCRPERKVKDTPKSCPAEAGHAKGVLNFSTGRYED
jgi:hypothetical protein